MQVCEAGHILKKRLVKKKKKSKMGEGIFKKRGGGDRYGKKATEPTGTLTPQGWSKSKA